MFFIYAVILELQEHVLCKTLRAIMDYRWSHKQDNSGLKNYGYNPWDLFHERLPSRELHVEKWKTV